MQCSISRDAYSNTLNIKAPNGNPSILYEHIRRAIPDNYTPDMYVMAAYNAGKIKGFSKDELALALWSKMYTDEVTTAIKDWDKGWFDENGEPLFSLVQYFDLIGLQRTNKNYHLSGSRGAAVFIKSLEDKGLIFRRGDEYRLTDTKRSVNDIRSGEEQNKEEILQTMASLGIPAAFAFFEENDGIYKVQFNNELFNVTREMDEYQDNVNAAANGNAGKIEDRMANREAIKEIYKKGNKLQRKIMKDLFKPATLVGFDKQANKYITAEDDELNALATAITGNTKDLQGKNGLQLAFGENARQVMEALALNKKFSEIEKLIDAGRRPIASQVYDRLRRQTKNFMEDGGILIPYLTIADIPNGIADTLDLLVLQPDGKITLVNLNISRDSILENKYNQEFAKAGEKSMLKGMQLSTFLIEGIRATGRRRLLENNGYDVEKTVSIAIHVPKDNKDYDVKIERTKYHSPYENQSRVNEIFPFMPPVADDKVTQFMRATGMGNPVRKPGFLTDDERMPEEEIQDPLDKMTVKTERQSKASAGDKKLMAEIDKLMQGVKNKPKSQMVQKLSELVKLTQHHLSRGHAQLAYGRFLGASIEEMDNILRYLADESKLAEDEYSRIAIEAGWYIKTFADIGEAMDLKIGNEQQDKRLRELKKLLKALDKRINLSLEAYIKHMVNTVSAHEIDSKEMKKIIEEAVDISQTDYLVRDLSNSRDTLIALADKLYKRQRFKSLDRIKKFEASAKAEGNRLAEAYAGADIEFEKLWETDAKGRNSGRMVQKIGPQYYNKLDELENKIRMADGLMKQYRTIDSLADARPEDIEYNKALYANNQNIRVFKQAEIHTETGVEDGMFHAYTKEFIDDRNKFEVYVPVYENGNFVGGRWERRKDEDGNFLYSNALHNQYRRKYYEQVIYDKPIFENGEFTGMFDKYGAKGWFVKEQFVQVREVAADGTSLVSEKWKSLRDDMSPRGRALWSFYNYFITEMEATLKLLPPNQQRSMFGKLARVRGNLIEQAKKRPDFFKAIAKTVTGWFNMKTYAKAPLNNEDGTIANQIPVFFTGNLRNEERIEELKNELKKLDEDYKNNRITRVKYLEERDTRQKELDLAEKSLTGDELETDLVKMLIAFRAMAENYDHMNAIEGTVNSVLKMLETRTYTKLDAKGNKKINRKTGEEFTLEDGTKSWAYKRYKKWMEMVFYNSDELDDGTFEVIAKKLMSASSVVNVGFNSFGAIHNYAMARINTAIETAGGLFYTRKAATRSLIVFEKEFLPGFLASINRKDGYRYKTKRAGSKYEALVNFFNIYVKQQSGEHRINIPALGYLIMEAGEYSAQTKSGIAYLMSHDLQNKRTKETVSIYDAFDFNSETGELTLKSGFDLNETIKHDITNAIREMNKKIHGNYAWEDRMVIQQHVVGQIAAQYHKWLMPAYDSRFRRRYFDQNLNAELEGRYVTILNLFRYMYEEQGSIFQKLKGGWKKMDEMQLRNMYKNAAELVFFMLSFAAYGLFHALAKDLDDDDDPNLKRWMNFLSWEADRAKREIVFWIPVLGLDEQIRLLKNPFAIGPTVEQFIGVVSEAFKVALPPYNDENYYDKGPFSGELRFKKELFDVLPIMKDINKWQSFSQVTSFYIK